MKPQRLSLTSGFAPWALVSLCSGLCSVGLLAAAAAPQATKPKPAASAATVGAKPAEPDAALGPQLVIETAKGTIVIQLFEKEAPKSVAQVRRLATQGFYRNQKIHRVVDGQLVQFGDKQSRDATLREWWGRGPNSGSGRPIGVAEISKTRKHKAGSVGMAHNGNPSGADSQIYITTRPMPNLDGKYTIIGEVTSGQPIVAKLQVGERLKEVTVKTGH